MRSGDSISSRDSFRSSSFLPTPVTHRRNCMSAAVKRYRYLRRLFKFQQMDFEFAFWQMINLFIAPQKVYRNFNYRKETKSQFARDDPAFLVLLGFWLFVASIGFTYVLRLSIGGFFQFLLYVIFIDYIGFGICIATILWYVSNKFLLKPEYRNQDVEWGYAFDVHLNAYFPPLIILHIFQLFFYNVFISQDWFLSRLFGNSLWLISIGYYIYITFLGYTCLPIVHKTQVLLYPMIPLFFVYILSLAAGWNITQTVMDVYLYRVIGHFHIGL
uniref:Protein unc-50 homolog n=1 Tax=Clastoptera arizonana TaxID=38151 RepID=A0A1B6DIF3_9HEMI